MRTNVGPRGNGLNLRPCLQELFTERAARSPAAVAIASGSEQLTYSELDRRSNQLSRYLAARGVGPDVVVGVSIPRSPALIIALLGILKAGGAYLPLESSLPAVRRRMMAADARASLVLSVGRSIVPVGLKSIDLDESAAAIAMESPDSLHSSAVDSDLAYVIFTSGSTGRPKGVMVQHRGVVNMLLWLAEFVSMSERDAVPFKMSLGFDFSVQEIFLPLICGARLLLSQAQAVKDEIVTQLEIDEAATVISFVPSVLQAWLQARAADWRGSARAVICCGEALPSSTVLRLRSTWTGVVVNLYGPTEASVFSSGRICGQAEHELEPIGWAIPGVQLHVLDENLEPVNQGTVGELYLGGVGLARGYVGQSGMTAQRFIASPFGIGERIYRTGDLAYHLVDGSLQYAGRVDQQVKLRGIRIELGEIEAKLLTFPGVARTAVVMRDDNRGDKHLVAFVILDENVTSDTARMRSHLLTELPEYMIPAEFVAVKSFPLNSSGKLDREVLRRSETAASGSAVRYRRPELRNEYVSPRNEIETLIAAAWEENLGVSPVGVFDDFLDLGGYSLLAIRVLASIRDRLGIELTVRDFFSAMNVAGLASLVETESLQLEEL